MWKVEELRAQGERQSARSEPALVLCSVDVTRAPHELGVGTGDTTVAPAGVEELLFPAVHPKFSVHIYIYLYIAPLLPVKNTRYKQCATAT